mgnify:CR=1 FL=1
MSGYKETTINTFMDNDKYDVISKHKYSKLLDEIVNTKYYNDKYINEYLLIKYIEQDGYLENISKMLDIGYDSNEINTIYEKLRSNGINYIKDNSYINDLLGLIRIDYFREQIEEWKNNNLISEDEYSYLLGCLLESVSKIANIAGVYGAYLKIWDPRAIKEI